ncbi:pseudouridylate synthase, putative [Bodo saltans]|uniref:Pseudouridylate synthase, putative n=1 Tax=Bodo saltans TaxID=75058 RepID=A0A0S4JH91_BODSA|nr:pseudouridylate synthase, putative [Bodo saltans]|eukprot:CUG89520.1 pseudouridylate synthase, putative [Bodo saltans]
MSEQESTVQELTSAPTLADSAETVAAAETAASDKRPKRKVAIVFGYVGVRYCGLQWNHDPTNPTVEEKMLHALHAAGFISDENMGKDVMQKLGWERSSRTDKGVHALKNLISLRIMVPPPLPAGSEVETDEAMWARAASMINEKLPSDIHVYQIVTVTRSFNAYQLCHGRKYEYFLPTFALMNAAEYQEFLPLTVAPVQPTEEDMEADDREYDALLAAASSSSGTQAVDGESDEPERRKSKKRRFEGADETGMERLMTYRTIPNEAMAKLSSYRISTENLARARSLFSRYVGTLRYHNFTPKGRSSDPSTIRYITSVTVDEPQIVAPGADDDLAQGYVMPLCYRPHGMEWVRIELEGQSFMLNQIRKMIGAVSSIMLSGLPDSYLTDVLLAKEVQRGVPMAPANGLFLSHLDYTKYNLRLDRIQTEGRNGAGKEGVYMDDVNADEVAALRKRVVDVIARMEMRDNITGRWMRSERHVLHLAWDIKLV